MTHCTHSGLFPLFVSVYFNDHDLKLSTKLNCPHSTIRLFLKLLNGLCFTILPRLQMSLSLVHLFQSNFVLLLNFLSICFDTAAFEQLVLWLKDYT